nr:16S rRNA (adenine(1518)-N(6)/adenine(1519)-N(6))-dimethyltransferase RsmA [uncultured Catonella sp.]
MAYLGQPQNTIAILKKYDFTFQKKFGQNFLIDTHVLEKIVDAADIGKEDLVLEIGPGIGTVTQYLCEAARQVIAVEIDRKLIKILKDTLSAYDNVEVINEDILKVDIAKLVEEKNEGKPIKVVSNLPYYITTPIIMTLLEKRVPVTDMTLMMQEEVARRMQAVPGNKDYGALSLAVQYYSVPYIAAFVPQNCFMPRPNVGSAVVNLKCHKNPPVEVMDEELMFKLIKASFAQRRKTLQNGLANSAELDFTKEEIIEAILKMQELLGMKQNPLIRGETLTLKEFSCLSDIFTKNKE